jgi:hypothetical protein
MRHCWISASDHCARACVLGSLGETVELTKAILGSIGYGLISPGIFIPALVVGTAGGRSRSAVSLSRSFHFFVGVDRRAPEGAEIIWPTTPIGLIPPFAWGAAGFSARNWYRRRAAAGQPGAAVSLFCIAVGVLVGGLGGGVVGSLIGMLYVIFAQVSSFEGGGRLCRRRFHAPRRRHRDRGRRIGRVPARPSWP